MIIPQVSSAALRLFPLGVLCIEKEGCHLSARPGFPLLSLWKASSALRACFLLHELTHKLYGFSFMGYFFTFKKIEVQLIHII